MDAEHREGAPSSDHMAGEREFWTRVARLSHPNWMLTIPTSSPKAGSQISSADTFLYVVVPSMGFTAVCAVFGKDVKTTVERVRTMPESFRRRIPDSAGAALLEAAKGVFTLESDMGQAMFTALVLSFAQTKTYSMLTSDNLDVRGHWLYVLYHMKDDSTLLRPAALAPDGPMLDADVLKDIARELLERDAFGPPSGVKAQIDAGGGLRLK